MLSFLVGYTSNNPVAGSTQYQPVVSQGSIEAWNSSLTVDNQQPLPHAITLDRLRVNVKTAPGSGKKFVFTVLKNGIATELTCTISGTNTSAQDLTDTVNFSAGDTITLQGALDSGGTAPAGTWWTARQSASGLTAILGSRTTTSTGMTGIMGVASGTITTEDSGLIVPCAGTVDNLFVNATGSGPVVAVYKNGTVTLLAATLTDSTGNNTTNSFTVVAGDRISINDATTGRVMSWGVSFSPTTDGQSFIGHIDNNHNLNTSVATYYQPLADGDGTWDTTEANTYLKLQACTILALYSETNTSPGLSPKSYTFTVRKNASSTPATVTINDASSTPNDGGSGRAGNITGQSITVNDDDNINIQATPASTPSGVHGYNSILIQTSSAVNYTQTTTTISRIQKVLSATQNTITRIQKLFTASQTTVSRISNASLTATQTTKTRIQNTLSHTTATVSRISKSFTSTNTTKSRIAILGNATTATLSRISNASLTATTATKSRIQKTASATTHTLSRISKSFTATSATVSRIAKSLTQTTATKSRIQKTLASTTSTLSRIQKALSATTSSVSRIQKSLTATTTTVSNIVANTGKTATTSTVSRILKTLSTTQTTLSRIAKSFTATTSTKSRISKLFTQTTATLARIQKALSATTATKSRIQTTNSATQPTKSRIQRLFTSTTNTLSRIAKGFTAITSTKSRIQNNQQQTTNTLSRIENTLTATTSTKSFIANPINPLDLRYQTTIELQSLSVTSILQGQTTGIELQPLQETVALTTPETEVTIQNETATVEL